MRKFAAFVALGLLLTGVGITQAQSKDSHSNFVEGDSYVSLPEASRLSDEGKVEVVEVFSYACIHCAHFAPIMDKLEKSLPDNVSVHYVPADFSPQWEPFARAYYAAKKLSIAKRTHLALFKAKFTEHYALNSLDDLADFYAHYGVDADNFKQVALSDEVTKKMRADTKQVMRWGIDGTPTIIVDGKYRSQNIKTYKQLAELTQWLVDKELDKAKS